MERRTGPPFRTLAEVRRVGGDAMTLSFGTAPFTLNNATRRGRAEHFLRAFSCEQHSRSSEPRQSLPMNDAAERTFSIPRSLVTPSARPLTMNDGPRVIGKRTIAGRPGLTCYSIVKESLSKESRFATWEL